MKNIELTTLNEIIRDFLKSGLDISIESFKDWFGLALDDKTYEYVGNKIYKLS
jgi:hypothetical protein